MRPILPLLLSALLLATGAVAAPYKKTPDGRWPHRDRTHLVKRQAEEDTPDEDTPPDDTPTESSTSAAAPVPSATGGVELKATKKNIWAPLTKEEATSVLVFLHGKTELNLTAANVAGEWDNYINLVDIVQPNKTAAVPYLDGNGPVPDRYAKVTIFFSTTNEPWVQDIMVGPLPVSDKTTWAPMDWATTSGNSKIRNYEADYSKVAAFKQTVHESVADIVQDLLNLTYANGGLYSIDPLWHEPNEDGSFKLISWLGYERDSEGIYGSGTLLGQGLAVKLNIFGRDPSKWEVLGWLYNNIYYSSTESFRNAWKAGLQKVDLNLDGPWTGTNRDGDAYSEDTMAPPLLIQPDGQRFGLDRENQYVKWNDFTFYISFAKDTGIKLFDIRYRGDRIVYELALQEAIAHYAGNEPIQSGTSYLDGYYGFGAYTYELLSGYDCPSYAAYMDTHIHIDEQTRTHPKSICIFEQDMGYPLSRHTTGSMAYATKNIVLQVRTIATVGNYDYIFTHTFSQDGNIEVAVQASGYIKASHYSNNQEYGYKIHDALSGSMHDHVLTFKIDLDVVGSANTFVKHEFVQSEEKYVWSNTTRKTMKLARANLENENDAKLEWTENGQTSYVVENQDAKNKYGENRGYKVMMSKGAGASRLTIQESPNLLNSMNFAKHGLYVTQRKDNEANAAHALNAYDCANPLVNFDNFFNGESLVQQDIVVWVNLGMHHAPHTGDLPNTLTSTAQSAFILAQHNYLNADPSRASRLKTEIQFDDNKVTKVDDSGCKPYAGTYEMAGSVVDFMTYSGDTYERKYPTDPLTQYDNTTAI